MIKKEMIAMLLAGGQGSRLGVLTQKVAKPAVSLGEVPNYRFSAQQLYQFRRGHRRRFDAVSAITFKHPYRDWYPVGLGPQRGRCDHPSPLRGAAKAAIGIPELQMQFIRTWSIWRIIIRITF